MDAQYLRPVETAPEQQLFSRPSSYLPALVA
jgi:hypothetical protein